MAQLVLAEAGRQIGQYLLPNGFSALGVSIGGAEIGAAIGAVAGRAIDTSLAGPIGETGRIDGLTLLESREGAGMPRVYGRYRIGGQVIWSTHLKEKKRDRQVGGKGGPSITEYSYTISFAVGLCEGEIIGIERICANGEALSSAGLTYRLYRGTEDQLSDPLIEASEGTSPAYRGLAYIVFEDFPLDDFGARLPQLSFEVTRPVTGKARTLGDVVTSVNLIPASGEWVYSPELIRRIEYPGWEETLNRHSGSGEVDIARALDQLQAELPKLKSVNLTLAWFGSDLRCGSCEIRPGVETRDQINLPRDWSAGGTDRQTAYLISRDEDGRPYYGGTPDDASVLALLDDLANRGIEVTLSPFLLMDIPPGNGLADPYDGTEQAAFPWRGRITSAGDKTASARDDVNAFFGEAAASDFALNGNGIVYTGPTEWSYRRFVLHLAMLGKAAGNIEAFLLGSELRGLTRLRDEDGRYPAVEQLIALATEVRALLGPDVKISYAADWTEYGAFVPDDGSGDVLFPLDDLWADGHIDFIGLDWYAPLSDWRDNDHLDAALYEDITDPDYLAANIEGGEGYDWHYASLADRDGQIRTPITDTAHGEDWLFRVKDIRNWWSNRHFERPGGTRSQTSTAWMPEAKPIRFVEIGCGAVDKGTNAPNVFIDPKSAESGFPWYSDGTRDDAIQSAAIMALYDYWASNSPVSGIYGGPMVEPEALSVWCYDARPFPAFPLRSDIWSDAENWSRGHWLNGRLSNSALGAMIEEISGKLDLDLDISAVDGAVSGYSASGLSTIREFLDPLAFAFGLTCRHSETGLIFANRADGAVKDIATTDYALAGRQISATGYSRTVTDHAPKGVRVTLVDPSADYQTLSVHVGDAPEGDRDLHIRLPMALDEDAVTELAQIVYTRTNQQRVHQTLTLSPERADISIGDLVRLDEAEDLLRVNGVERRGVVQLDLGVPETGFEGSAALSVTRDIPGHVPTPDMVIMDIANLPGEEDDIRPLVGAFAYPWPGSVTISAGASATGLTARAGLSQPASIGRLLGALPGGPGDRFRPGTSLDIRFPQADLAARSRLDVLNGANLMAIETGGGWMLLSYETAELMSSDTWRISGLLTGLSGTEDLAMLGAQDGARAVLIDSALSRADFTSHELGTELIWQGKGAGANGDVAQQTLALQGRALRPLRPGHLQAERLANGDISLRWTRRARHSADRWDTPDVPMLEDELRFRVGIYDGETLLRSTEVSETSWIYSLSDQQADDAPSTGFSFGVVQIASGFGDGVVARCEIGQKCV